MSSLSINYKKNLKNNLDDFKVSFDLTFNIDDFDYTYQHKDKEISFNTNYSPSPNFDLTFDYSKRQNQNFYLSSYNYFNGFQRFNFDIHSNDIVSKFNLKFDNDLGSFKYFNDVSNDYSLNLTQSIIFIDKNLYVGKKN